jgi:hypothetical protein
MIIAKPVVPDQFWILKQDDEKIGNIQATANGFTVKILDQVENYKNVRMIKQRIGIDFEPAVKTNKKPQNQVHGFDTGCAAYNGIYEVRRQLPLFTKTRKSKSWYAAGWYQVMQNRTWQVIRNPKLITLQRYPYHGPFHTDKEAQ